MLAPVSKTSLHCLTDLALRLSNNFLLYSETRYYSSSFHLLCFLFTSTFVSSFSVYVSTFIVVLYFFRQLLNPSTHLLLLLFFVYVLFSPTFPGSPSVTFHHPDLHLTILRIVFLADAATCVLWNCLIRFPVSNVSDHGISRTYIPDIEPECWKSNIMAPLVRSASRFLFPCTVEYSLLCAVILGVMWINACSENKNQHSDPTTPDSPTGRVSGVNIIYTRSVSQFSVDCTSAHKGLFAGILMLVLSIVSLIMFYELVQRPQYVDEAVLQVSPPDPPHTTLEEVITITTSLSIHHWQSTSYSALRNLRRRQKIVKSSTVKIYFREKTKILVSPLTPTMFLGHNSVQIPRFPTRRRVLLSVIKILNLSCMSHKVSSTDSMTGVRFSAGAGIFHCECCAQAGSEAHLHNLSRRYQD